MKKMINTYSMKSAALLFASTLVVSFIGCGGDSGSDNNSPSQEKLAQAKVGYYLDAAVAGVHYDCDGITGTTGANGEFKYVPKSACIFELAGVPLRQLDTSVLSDENPYFVERDPNVASVLQSIDVDGDPTNGITITPEVESALKDSFSKHGIKQLPNPEQLVQIVQELQQKVANFNGNVVSPDEALAHISETLREVEQLLKKQNLTKEEKKEIVKTVVNKYKTLLAGKTFYIYEPYDGGLPSAPQVLEVTFNDDVTQVNIGGSIEPVTLTDNKIHFVNENKTEEIEIPTWTDKGILIGGDLIYFNRADAQSDMQVYYNTVFALDFLHENNNKTVYLVGKDINGTVKTADIAIYNFNDIHEAANANLTIKDGRGSVLNTINGANINADSSSSAWSFSDASYQSLEPFGYAAFRLDSQDGYVQVTGYDVNRTADASNTTLRIFTEQGLADNYKATLP